MSVIVCFFLITSFSYLKTSHYMPHQPENMKMIAFKSTKANGFVI